MEQDRTSPSYLPAEMPEARGKVHPLRPAAKTLGESIGPAIDQIRQIPTDLGLRPYRVWLVHWMWPERRGVGVPREISRIEMLPTPVVSDMTGIPFNLAAVGLTEGGGVSLSNVSQRYSEDDLTGRSPLMRDTVRTKTSKSTMEFFYEIGERRATDPSPKRRRFVVSGVPMLNRTGMRWRVNLTKAESSYDGPLDVTEGLIS